MNRQRILRHALKYHPHECYAPKRAQKYTPRRKSQKAQVAKDLSLKAHACPLEAGVVRLYSVVILGTRAFSTPRVTLP
jgi:hypothetical protein